MLLIIMFVIISQFRWIHENRTFTDDDITVDGMTSYISVSAVEENFGTYTCYVTDGVHTSSLSIVITVEGIVF